MSTPTTEPPQADPPPAPEAAPDAGAAGPAEAGDQPAAPVAAAVEEQEFAGTAEEGLDPTAAARLLRGVVGGLGGIGVGGLSNNGQSVVGDGGTAIGAVYVTASTGQGEARSWSGPLTEDALARMSETYAQRTWDAELDEHLRRRHVLYLSGPAGTGRFTAACLALGRRHGPGAGILLAPEARFTEIAGWTDRLTGERGHVLQLTGDARPDPMAFATLEAKAKDQGATVIVIGHAGHERDLADYVVEYPRPDMRAVFRAHLMHRLGERGTCLGGCGDCLGECVGRYVEQCLGHAELAAAIGVEQRISEVVGLAMAIVREGAPTGDALSGLLGAHLPAVLRRDARRILRTAAAPAPDGPAEGNGSAEYRRAFRIAYAVFDGEPLAHVFEAADRLVDPSGERKRDELRPPLGLEAEALLGDGLAAPATDSGGPAAGLPRVARLRNRRLVTGILDVAWNDWGLSDRLLRWLDALAQSGRPNMRDRAALAAGLLAAHDFGHVYGALVDRWAGHPSWSLRNVAAFAALATAYDQGVRVPLSQRVRDWAGGRSAFQRDSAARAYVLGLGHILPYHSLGDLRTVAQDRLQRRNDLVAMAVDETYPSVTPAVMVEMLREWAAADHPFVPVHALRAFVLLAARPAADPRSGWPELLARTADGEVAIADLAELWALALIQPATAFDAWRRLGYWISRAAGRPDLANRLALLLGRLCADPPLRDRVAHHLAHVWRRQMPQNPLLPRLAAMVEGDAT